MATVSFEFGVNEFDELTHQVFEHDIMIISLKELYEKV